jgi:hypothetical protein
MQCNAMLLLHGFSPTGSISLIAYANLFPKSHDPTSLMMHQWEAVKPGPGLREHDWYTFAAVASQAAAPVPHFIHCEKI